MYLSIIGSPQCGKTTLFRALAGAGQNKGGVAVIDVPDERVDRLSGIFHPKKTVYGRVEVCDTEPIQEGDMKAGTIPAELLRQMRPADAFIVVLNGYNAPAAAGVADAASGVHTLVNELMIADMIQIETRLERIRKQAGRKESALEQEKEALEQCLAHLEQGSPLRSLPLFATDGKQLRGFQFLSLKPLMVVVNCSEDAMRDGASIGDEVRAKIAGIAPDAPVVAACAALEAELAAMPEEDKTAFMTEYGLTESLKGTIIRLAYETLGLIIVFNRRRGRMQGMAHPPGHDRPGGRRDYPHGPVGPVYPRRDGRLRRLHDIQRLCGMQEGGRLAARRETVHSQGRRHYIDKGRRLENSRSGR